MNKKEQGMALIVIDLMILEIFLNNSFCITHFELEEEYIDRGMEFGIIGGQFWIFTFSEEFCISIKWINHVNFDFM